MSDRALPGSAVPELPTAPPPVELPSDDLLTKERALEIARLLWSFLDDIDTLDDLVKNNDAAYRTYAQRIQRRRFEVGTTDGYQVGFFARDS